MKKRTLSEVAGTRRRVRADGHETITVTATEAQNGFGRILETVAQGRVVIITRNNTPHAVMMSVDRFEVLSGSDAAVLDTLTAEFDALFEKMQQPEVRAATRRVFDASPDELRKAAMEAARERGG